MSLAAPALRERTVRRAHGRLALAFERHASGITHVDVRERRPPLAVIRAFATAGGAALVHVHNVSGGVLAGDELDLEVAVGPGARAQVTSVGATQVYRSADGSEARQRVAIRVEAGGLLEYLPDPLIPFAGAVYSQTTRVSLAEGAGLYWWEVVAPGRMARGETFAYERLALRAEIRAAGRPIAVERFEIAPAVAPTSSLARLGGFEYFGTLYACRVGIPPDRFRQVEARMNDLAAEIERPREALFGCSALPEHGLAVRALAASRRAISEGFDRFWKELRRDLDGEEAVPPRKTR